MGQACSNTTFLGINWDCLNGQDVGLLLAFIFGGLVLAAILILSITANIAYLREKWQAGKRLILRWPWAFGDRSEPEKPKAQDENSAANRTWVQSWLLPIVVIVITVSIAIWLLS